MSKENIYLIFTSTKTPLSKVIGIYTKSEYNHVSIALDPDFAMVYSFGRKNFNNPFLAGFVQEDLQDRIFQKANCIIYTCKISFLQSKKIQKVLNNFTSKEHYYKYNFLGLFGVILGKSISRNNAFFCSQFVAYVLSEASIALFHKPLELTTPQDIKQISQLICIYQGKVNAICQSNLKIQGDEKI